MPRSRRDDDVRRKLDAGGYGYPSPRDQGRWLRISAHMVRAAFLAFLAGVSVVLLSGALR